MDLPPAFMTMVNGTYQMLAYADYPAFVSTMEGMRDNGAIVQEDLDELLDRFPDPRPSAAPAWEEDEGTEIYLRNPPDLDPLATLPLSGGWLDEEEAASLSLDSTQLSSLIGPWGEDVLNDIQANALRILNGCNDPRNDGANWGQNKQGLVFGPVQSGKTANMLSLIQVGMRAGYRLFIILAGDKTSLRDQTQNRVNRAFDLVGGINTDHLIHSPTFQSDFRQSGGGYSANFKFNERAIRGQKWTTIIVMKKQTNHLQAIVNQIIDFHNALPSDLDSDNILQAMILDDEADYASQDTDMQGFGSTTWRDLVNLRGSLPRNCYVAYTATPQACLSASPDDPIGYPRDFWWMIEPFTDKDENGIRRPRTYLGSWEVFWEYDSYLLHRMDRNEWPHHEKDAMGKARGVYVPAYEIDGEGNHTKRLTDHETLFLEEILSDDPDNGRATPPTLLNASMDFIITCGVRWWREWNKTGLAEKPSVKEIERSYDYHAMMVHLSLKQENQEMIRTIVKREWPNVVEAFKTFDPATSADDHPFRERWRLQLERSRALRGISSLPFEDIAYFMRCCIEIVTQPIFDSRTGSPYTEYPGKPWIYLLNSSDEGMELNYSSISDWQVQTKKAAIIVGGNILSRGLTVEGLSVTVFGRTSMSEMMDTVLQRGRWFGHKMSQIDITAIHLQDEAREVFRQIAEADRYLRLQIKQSLHEGHSPLEVLVEMRNSPFVSPTSRAKRRYLTKHKGFGFSGKRPLLNTPSFDPSQIRYNHELLEGFFGSHAEESIHERGSIAWDLDPDVVIRLLENFKCDKAAPQVSFQVFADYLKEWRVEANNGEAPPLPAINIGVVKLRKRMRRLRTTMHPESVERAVDEVTTRFGTIVGTYSDDRTYLGDAFFDYDEDWHASKEGVIPSKTRARGEPILILLYQLDSNYIRPTYYDMNQHSDEHPHGKVIRQEIRVPSGHPLYVPGDTPVVTFAAWVPEGGPMYSVGTNRLIDRSKIKQQGLAQVNQEEGE